jgi:hypothetical protein
MRHLAAAFAASILIAACGSSNGGDAGGTAPPPPATGGTAATVSCTWSAGTCDQYTGQIDPFFASSLQMTCKTYGTSFASSACAPANRVGACDLGSSSGMANVYVYYAPAYDAASAQADCAGHGVGATFIP